MKLSIIVSQQNTFNLSLPCFLNKYITLYIAAVTSHVVLKYYSCIHAL